MNNRRQNPLHQLLDQGQAVWLDSIQRGHLVSGGLKQLIEEDGLRGETANPTLFEQALSDPAGDYDEQLRALSGQGLDANAIYVRMATDDVRMACDLFRPLYDRLDGADGFVSLEVSPKLAYDTQGTLAEVRRFWQMVDRPNLMIKIPGTPAGVPAIAQALYEGININITLLFSVAAYEQVAWAYIRALERRLAEARPIRQLASVASFFVSRIDTLADQKLDEKIKQTSDRSLVEELEALKGKVAVGSLSDLVFVLERETTVAAINDVLRQEAASERYQEILGVTDEPLVSSDIIKDPRAAIVQLDMTRVVGGDLVKLMCWYDNEWGFTNQMIRLSLETLGARQSA